MSGFRIVPGHADPTHGPDRRNGSFPLHHSGGEGEAGPKEEWGVASILEVVKEKTLPTLNRQKYFTCTGSFRKSY